MGQGGCDWPRLAGSFYGETSLQRDLALDFGDMQFHDLEAIDGPEGESLRKLLDLGHEMFLAVFHDVVRYGVAVDEIDIEYHLR
jgi:hypothetical protein